MTADPFYAAAPASAVRGGSEGSTRSSRAAPAGRTQFQRQTLGVLDDDERAQLHLLLRKLAGLPAEDDPARADAVTGPPLSPSGPDG